MQQPGERHPTALGPRTLIPPPAPCRHSYKKELGGAKRGMGLAGPQQPRLPKQPKAKQGKAKAQQPAETDEAKYAPGEPSNKLFVSCPPGCLPACLPARLASPRFWPTSLLGDVRWGTGRRRQLLPACLPAAPRWATSAAR
jgi:hypothetical protein